jgi:hypothetical protein
MLLYMCYHYYTIMDCLLNLLYETTSDLSKNPHVFTFHFLLAFYLLQTYEQCRRCSRLMGVLL